MQTFELVPSNGRKSFNRKARVELLYSYIVIIL